MKEPADRPSFQALYKKITSAPNQVIFNCDETGSRLRYKHLHPPTFFSADAKMTRVKKRINTVLGTILLRNHRYFNVSIVTRVGCQEEKKNPQAEETQLSSCQINDNMQIDIIKVAK